MFSLNVSHYSETLKDTVVNQNTHLCCLNPSRSVPQRTSLYIFLNFIFILLKYLMYNKSTVRERTRPWWIKTKQNITKQDSRML